MRTRLLLQHLLCRSNDLIGRGLPLSSRFQIQLHYNIQMQTRYHIFEMHSRRHLLTLQSTFLNMHVSGNASCWKEGKKKRRLQSFSLSQILIGQAQTSAIRNKILVRMSRGRSIFGSELREKAFSKRNICFKYICNISFGRILAPLVLTQLRRRNWRGLPLYLQQATYLRHAALVRAFGDSEKLCDRRTSRLHKHHCSR